jgi:hypothetical protein
MKNLRINETIRVAQIDPNQWALQRKRLVKNEINWTSISFHTEAKSLSRTTRQKIGDIAAETARSAAYDTFDRTNVGEEIEEIFKEK